MHELTSYERERYQQQLNLQEVGVAGQLRLKQAKVACIGAGGLGTPLLLYLAAAGVGTLGIVDDDKVELSNLPRQILYGEQDLGLLKVECAKTRLLHTHATTNIDIYPVRLNADNARAILASYDIVVDCSDNFATRYLLNDICHALDKPLVSASIMQFQGQCMTLYGKRGPCLRCLFPKMPQADAVMTCEQAGVMNVLPGLFGVMQAMEVQKWLLQQGELLLGRVLVIDGLKMQFSEYYLPKNPDCELCGDYRNMHAKNDSEPYLEANNVMNQYMISPRELRALMQDKADIQLVDVRALDKHLAFNIGGKHIPTSELSDRFNELDPAKMVVTYCTSGGNSMRALQFLLSAGFSSVKSLDGGMTAWQEEM